MTANLPNYPGSETPRVMVAVAADIPRAFLADNLQADGFTPVAVSGVQHATCRITDDIDVLLVDLEGDSVGLVDAVRSGKLASVDSQLLILALTHDTDRLDLIRLLQRGADDAVPEPWSYSEVRARLDALLRRAHAHEHTTLLTAGTLRVDTKARRVWVGDIEISSLSRKEFELLSTLASDPERVFTHRELLKSVWGISDNINTRTLDVHAGRLRNRLNIASETFVSNVWGVGYRLVI
jgi:two-component system phosphate regulon response regulator PhoB